MSDNNLGSYDTEDRDKRLQDEKIELLRSRQGLTEDTSEESTGDQPKRKMSFSEKIDNFFYHNKWWLGLSALTLIILAYVIIDRATYVEADLTVLVNYNSVKFYEQSENIEEKLGEYVGDVNNDGQVKINVSYNPIVPTEDIVDPQVDMANRSKLVGTLQTTSIVLFISDDASREMIEPSYMLDISKEFPNEEFIDGHCVYLKDTEFNSLIGADSLEINSDVYISLLNVPKIDKNDKKGMERYEAGYEALKKLIEDIN